MKLLREIASLGRAARAEAKLKVRLPLSRVEVVLNDDSQIAWLKHHDELVREELNVKQVEYTTDGDQYVQYTVVPNFKLLGPKVGKQVPAVKKALTEADGNALLQALQSDGTVTLDLADGPLHADQRRDRGPAAGSRRLGGRPGSQVASWSSTPKSPMNLRREGIAKDLIRTIQNQRKEIACEYTDRIEVGIVSEDPEVEILARCSPRNDLRRNPGRSTRCITAMDQVGTGEDGIRKGLRPRR